jgi:ABC-type multidrug transport system ATPase subunit/ABC-type multidrug transport system permease subunit
MFGYTGKVLFNEKPASTSTRNLLCFVEQEDLFIPSITPREHLIFSARLRMDKHISEADKVKKVNSLLSELGLTKCADTPIGGAGSTVSGNISGGEKKRLSLATELLSQPSVIFADEATSGLDSFMAEAVVAKLGRLARLGHTVLATIHQPSSYVFSAFNQLHLLADGRTAYSGSAEKALEFFASIGKPVPPLTNPADYYIKIMSLTDKSEEVLTAWEKGSLSKLLEIEGRGKEAESGHLGALLQKQEFAASWITQCRQLMKRTVLSYKRDATLGRMRLGQAIVLGVIIGLIYLKLGRSPIKPENVQSINGALFYAVLNQGMLGALGVLQVFPLEKPVFMRESNANAYSSSAYVVSKFVAEGPFQIVYPAIFGTLYYFIIGFGSLGAGTFFTFILFIVLTAMAAVSLGYLVGSIAPSVGVALALGPLILMPLIIFGGLLVNVDDIDPWFVWISYLSMIRYGYEGVMVTIWEKQGDLGKQVLSNFNFYVSHKWRNIGCLCGLIFGFRAICWALLKLRTTRKVKQQ